MLPAKLSVKKKPNIFFFDQNRVLADVIPFFETISLPIDANLIVSSQDTIGIQKKIIQAARYFQVPTLVMQHGLYAPRAYTSVFDKKYKLEADKIMVWGPAERQRLIDSGISADRVIVTGTTILDHFSLPAKEFSENTQKNIVFSHTKWTHDIEENSIIANILRKIKHYNIVTKIVTTLPKDIDLSLYDSPIYSDPNSYNHLQICESVLKNASAVVSAQEGTFELLAHYMGIPVIIVDLWKPKIHDGSNYKEIKSMFISDACYLTELEALEQTIYSVIDNPYEKEEQRKQFLYDFAAIGFDEFKPIERIINTIQESYDIHQNEISQKMYTKQKKHIPFSPKIHDNWYYSNLLLMREIFASKEQALSQNMQELEQIKQVFSQNQQELEQTKQVFSQNQQELEQTKQALKKLLVEIDNLQEEPFMKLFYRFRHKSLHDSLNPLFQKNLNDSYIFQKVQGFFLQASNNLQKKDFISYKLEFKRRGLSGIWIAPLLNLPASQGVIGIEIVSSEKKIVVHNTLPIINLVYNTPAHFAFDALPETLTETWEIRVFVRDSNIPIHILEWQKYSFGGLGRLKTRAFMAFDFLP
ncbi:MAG: hypothetical protein IT292_01800 [Deltaproteobacteria bacterium]|nr:hypothetical protein [Deltaproteobacteria bacterium]